MYLCRRACFFMFYHCCGLSKSPPQISAFCLEFYSYSVSKKHIFVLWCFSVSLKKAIMAVLLLTFTMIYHLTVCENKFIIFNSVREQSYIQQWMYPDEDPSKLINYELSFVTNAQKSIY